MEKSQSQEAYLFCGLPGSGKTTYALELMKTTPLVRFSIDEAMYKKHGRYNIDYPHTQYKELERVVYEELDQELVDVIKEGHSVILDYGFWQRHEREKYKRLLGSLGVRWHLLYFRQDKSTLKQRLEHRNTMTGPNALHVDEDLFERMHQKFEEPVDEGEEIIVTDLSVPIPNVSQSN